MYYTPESFLKYYNNEEYHAAIESRLTAAQRKALPDEAFGLPTLRKYPLIIKDENGTYDWSHLKNAIAYFNTCKDEKLKKELATNIANVIKKYNIDIKISPNNKIRNYANFPLSTIENNEKKDTI